MINYLIIFIFLVILFYIYKGSITNQRLLKQHEKHKIENFKNYILDIKKNIENSGELDGYTMIKLKNPSDNEYVLQQDHTAESYYQFIISLECSKNYKIFYWKSNTGDYNGEDFFIEIYNNDQKGKIRNILSPPTVTCRKVMNDLIWIGVYHTFKAPSRELKITIPKFRQNKTKKPPVGSKYFSNIKINRYYPQLSYYELQDYLTCYILAKSDYNVGKTILDLTQNNPLKFTTYPIIDNYGVYVENNPGFIENPHEMFDPKKLSIILTYIPEEYENGSLVYIPCLNDYNMGIDISFQTNSSSSHSLVLNIVNTNYIYDIGLIHNPIKIAIIILDSVPSVYHQGSLIAYSSKHSDKIIDRGTCPDGWLYSEKNKCEPNSSPGSATVLFDSDDYTDEDETDTSNITTTNSPIDYNLSDTNSKKCSVFITDKFTTNNKKKKWSDDCNVNWTNCKNIKLGEIAPSHDKSCQKDLNLNFINKPILINKDQDLGGRLFCLFLYKTALSSNDMAYVYEYLSQLVTTGDDGSESAISRPSLNSSRLHTYAKHNEYSTSEQKGVADTNSAQYNTCSVNRLLTATSSSGTTSDTVSDTTTSLPSVVAVRDYSTDSVDYTDPAIDKLDSCISKYNNIPKTKSKCVNCKSDISLE